MTAETDKYISFLTLVGKVAGKQGRTRHSPSCLDCLILVLRILLSQHGPGAPEQQQGGETPTCTAPTQAPEVPRKLRTFLFEDNVGKLERRNPEGAEHLKALLVHGVTRATRPAVGGNHASHHVGNRISAGKNSK